MVARHDTASTAGAHPETGEEPVTAIDRAHLARQTMDDADLQREVLGLFADQMADMAAVARQADGAARRRLAHTVKGSARGVGAFALAALAERLEADSGDDALADRLCRAMEDVGAAIRRDL